MNTPRTTRVFTLDNESAGISLDTRCKLKSGLHCIVPNSFPKCGNVRKYGTFFITGLSGSCRTLISLGSASVTSVSGGTPSAAAHSWSSLVGTEGFSGGIGMYICSSLISTYSSGLLKMSAAGSVYCGSVGFVG